MGSAAKKNGTATGASPSTAPRQPADLIASATADLEEQQRHRDRSEEPAQRILAKRPKDIPNSSAPKMGKEQYMKLEQVDGDDEEAVVEAWLVRPQLLLLLPAARRWLQRGAAASDPSHSAQAHEITVELATPISVDQQEELLQTKFWCRYAARMVWAQARIVIPICTYVIAFKDGVLGGATAGIVPLVLAVLATSLCG